MTEQWIDRTETTEDTITAPPVPALSATLNRPDPTGGTFADV